MKKFLFGLLLAPAAAVAAVPPQIQFQGQFSSTGTLPAIEFRLVDSPSSDAALNGWSESTAPFTTDGSVSLLLGSQTPIPPEVFAAPATDRYLWIKVGSAAAVRQKLVSVPFSFRAGVADALSPDAAGAGFTTEKAAVALKVRGEYDQVVIEETDGPTDEKRWILKADVGDFSLLTANDGNSAWSDAMVVKRSGVGVDLVSFPNGRWGFGTVNPTREMEVVGALRVTGNGINKDIELNSPIRATILPMGPNVPENQDFQIRSAHMGTMQVNNDNPGNVTLAVGGGRTGVGTPNPQHKLDVAGTVNASEYLLNGAPFGGANPWGAIADGIAYTGGNVGIGTTSPTREVEIVGALRVTGNGINKDIELNSPVRATILPMGPNVPENQDFQIRSAHMGTMQVNNDNPGNVTLAAGGGKVGVGTASPNAKLQVAGGDVAVTGAGTGVILKAFNGANCYRVRVNNAGVLSTQAVACP